MIIWAEVAGVSPETSHDLIETQKGAVLLCDVPQTLQEAGLRGDEARVAHNWLKDDPRNLSLVLLENPLHVIQIVVYGRERGGCREPPQLCS